MPEKISPQEMVLLGAQSLPLYGQLFFPRTFRQEPAPFHYDMGKRLYSSARLQQFKIFRGAAKTSYLRVFGAQRISYNISRTIMFVSVSQDHAKFSLRWLKRQIDYNRLWTSTFRLRKGSKWTDEHIEIVHGVEEEPINILAVGITGQIRGFNIDDYRPDLIIADDILNEENTATPEQRRKVEDLFLGALINSLSPASESPRAKAILLQTPFHKDDLSEKLSRDPAWHSVTYGCFDEKGESRWPARWSTETLKRDKASATAQGNFSLWMREMECKIVQRETKIFDVSRLAYWDSLPPGLSCVTAIDPASSDSKTADDNVVLTAGVYQDRVYVAAYHADTGQTPEATAAHFFEQAMQYRPRILGVESIAYQRTLAWFLEQEMNKRRMWVPVNRIQDKRRKSNRIIQAISGLLHFGRPVVHKSMEKLVQQIDDYDPQVEMKDDVLDALSMAIMMLFPHLLPAVSEEEENILELAADGEPLIYERGAP